MNRRERRAALKNKKDPQSEMIRKMNKPATKLELYASSKELDERIDIIDRFLTQKFGDEFVDFVKNELGIEEDSSEAITEEE